MSTPHYFTLTNIRRKKSTSTRPLTHYFTLRGMTLASTRLPFFWDIDVYSTYYFTFTNIRETTSTFTKPLTHIILPFEGRRRRLLDSHFRETSTSTSFIILPSIIFEARRNLLDSHFKKGIKFLYCNRGTRTHGHTNVQAWVLWPSGWWIK